MACNPRRSVRRQKQRSLGHVFWLADPPERQLFGDFRPHFGGHKFLNSLVAHNRRSDRIGSDAEGAEFLSEVTHQHESGSLRRSVGRRSQGHQSASGGTHQDDVALSPSFHLRNKGLHREKLAIKIGIEGCAPLLLCDIEDGNGIPHSSGECSQHVECSETFVDGRPQSRQICGGRYVCCDAKALPAISLNLTNDSADGLLVATVYHNFGTRTRERACSLRA